MVVRKGDGLCHCVDNLGTARAESEGLCNHTRNHRPREGEKGEEGRCNHQGKVRREGRLREGKREGERRETKGR